MCTITLKIDENDSKAKEFLLYIESFAAKNASVDIWHEPNEETLKSMDDAQKGKVFKAKDVDDLFNQLDA